MTPISSLATLNPGLSSLFQYMYEESERYFVGAQLLPTMPQGLAADNFGVVTLKSLAANSSDTTLRVAGTGYSRGRYEFTADTYSCKDHGMEEILDDSEARRYLNYFVAEQVATRRLIHKILTARERRTINAVLDVSYYSGDASLNQTKGNGAWSSASSTPIADVEGAVRKVRDNTGVTPNALVINWKTFRTLRQHAEVAAKISSVGAGRPETARDITVEMLKAVFDIDNILVAGAMQNTANPAVDPVMADIWPNHAFVTKIATSQDMMEPCIGRCFHWTGDNKTGSNDSGIDGYVETYREEQIRSEVIRARHNTDEKILYKDLACLISSVIA